MRVLIAVDDSEYSMAVMESVKQRSWPFDTEFILLTVAEVSAAAMAAARSQEELEHLNSLRAEQAAWETGLRERVQLLSEDFINACPDHKITPIVDRGDIVSRILNDAQEFRAEYIIVGAHPRTSHDRAVLGSVSLNVQASASCPIEIIKCPGLHEWMKNADARDHQKVRNFLESTDFKYRRILFASDLTPDSHSALLTLSTANWIRDSHVSLVHVVQRTSVDPKHLRLLERPGSFHPSAPSVRDIEKQLEEYANTFSELAGKGVHVYHSVLENPNVAEHLVKYARDWGADLIVLSSSKEADIFGSVSRQIAGETDRSVLLLRGKANILPTFEWIEQEARNRGRQNESCHCT